MEVTVSLTDEDVTKEEPTKLLSKEANRMSNDFTDEEEQAQIRIDIQLQVQNRSPASVELPNESGVEEQLLLTLHLQWRRSNSDLASNSEIKLGGEAAEEAAGRRRQGAIWFDRGSGEVDLASKTAEGDG
ncbi:hypothetical protein U1Q18_009562, partial [Sarracenia purpurea var. burkii]